MKVYLVEAETGSCEQGNAMIFDAVFSTYALADAYCAKYRQIDWDYSISEITVDIEV